MVRKISERQNVACPSGAACVFVERDFEVQRQEERWVRLHVRVPLIGLLSLDKEVDVRVVPTSATTQAGTHVMDVSWEPAGGPFPRFRGALRIEPVGDEACALELSGRYEPPGGLIGAAFDSVLGHRIARATMRELVSRIGRSLAAEYDRRVKAAVI
jgi:hypothetical protein